MTSPNQTSNVSNSRHVFSLSHLSAGYRDCGGFVREVIHKINWSVNRGEYWAVIGESGSGKTTLILALAGLLRHVGGEIISGSVEWLLPSPPARAPRDWVLLPQGSRSAIYPLERIGNQITSIYLDNDPGLSREQAQKRTIDLLSELRLEPADVVAKALPDQLSGGMRQRAALALAMAGKPKVLLLDEPTNGLDWTTEVQVLNLISFINRHHRTSVVAIMHNLVRATQLASHLAVMYKGNLVESGLIERVLDSPRHPYTRELIEEARYSMV